MTAPPIQPHQESLLWGSELGQVIVVADESALVSKPEEEENTEAFAVLRDLAWCEHVLDAEHREWLRLMYDAEWFG